MRTDHLRAIQALSAAIAIAPFVVLVACGPKASPPPTSEPAKAGTSGAASAAESAPVSASAATGATATSSSAAAASASATTPASSTPPEDVGPPPRYAGQGLPCGAAVGTFIDAHKACKADADCAVTNTGCGMPGHCGVGVQAKAVGELQNKSRAAVAACQKAGVPLPCATCTALPPARCAGGFCRP